MWLITRYSLTISKTLSNIYHYEIFYTILNGINVIYYIDIDLDDILVYNNKDIYFFGQNINDLVLKVC